MKISLIGQKQLIFFLTRTELKLTRRLSRFFLVFIPWYTDIIRLLFFFLNQHCYSGNNVLVNKPILFNCSCTVGDRSSNMRNRTCIGQIILLFWPCSIVFCNFFTEFILKQRRLKYFISFNLKFIVFVFLKQRNNVSLKLFHGKILTIFYMNVSCQR